MAAGLAGALEGTRNIPAEWIDTVDEATLQNEYTVSQRLLRPTAQGITQAIINEMNRKKQVVADLEAALNQNQIADGEGA